MPKKRYPPAGDPPTDEPVNENIFDGGQGFEKAWPHEYLAQRTYLVTFCYT